MASAHLVGICGAGMKALAELAAGLGWRVSGSDQSLSGPVAERLRRWGVRVHAGHEERFVPDDVDVLVYSPAVAAENPERQAALRRGVPQMSYSQMLGLLMQSRTGVCVAGTHGKSTTTAMTARILTDAGLDPSAAFGAELVGRGTSGWAGDGELLVVESCEYQRSFLDLRPKFAAILGVEPDHFDCYRTFDETRAAFAEFAAQVAADGLLLVRGDCAASVAAAKSAGAEVATFSQQPDADWWAADLRPIVGGMRFRIFRRGQYFTEITLPLPGEQNVMNALAAAALSHAAGASAADIRESLHEFPGLRRRFEPVGSWRGMTLIDDYAHHPTAVRATLATARVAFGDRRIWCAFQPHQVSRTRALLGDFACAFADADEVLVAPVYAAREQLSTEPAHVAAELATQIAATGRPARFLPSLDRMVATLEDEARPGDVLMTMGAGDVYRVHHEFTRRLQRHHAAG